MNVVETAEIRTTAIAPPGPRGAWRWLQWVVIPLLLAGAAELVCRVVLRQHGAAWYDREEAALKERVKPRADVPTIDAIFLGSSRVQAAIDAETFAAELQSRLGRPARVLNFGMGHTTLAEHYWGVRNLIDAAGPGGFRGCTVFVEAAGGMPVGSTWDDLPYQADQPQLLLPVMRAGDLGRLWHAPAGIQEKALLTARWALRGSAALAHKERVREQVVNRGAQVFASRFEPRDEAGGASMAEAGGIKVDAESIKAARDYALTFAAEEMKSERPYGDWDRTIAHDLVEMVKAAGGRVVFFDVPRHPISGAPLRTPVRLEDRKRFEAAAARWGTPVIAAEFAAADEDFPDVWHLGLAKAKPFSVALARAYWERGR
jgi:hypothetical protein